MRLYLVNFADDTAMNFWAENMSHAEEQALDARQEKTPETVITDIHRYDDLEGGSLGFCDECDKLFLVYSDEDHCIQCLNCFEHCTDKFAPPSRAIYNQPRSCIIAQETRMTTFTDEQALAIFDAVYDEEKSYSAQQIFDQVWEAPYSWFMLISAATSTFPAMVAEMDEDGETIVSSDIVTEDQIKIATIKNYFTYWYNHWNPNWKRTLQVYLGDLDANDVDSILQLAMFGEIRYS
jgi:NAD-dependent dihydropyrimidine dehydrogenase PreA subunit